MRGPGATLAHRPTSAVRARTLGAFGGLLLAATALWLVLSATGWLLTGPLHRDRFVRWDGAADRWFAAHRSSTWNAVTHVITFAAETTTVVALGAVLFVALRLRLGRWREPLLLAATLAGEVTVFIGTTALVSRPRPDVVRLDAAPPTSSFPSGHTAAAVALYGGVAAIVVGSATRTWLRALVVAAAVVLALAVGCARIYRGMHYPTDVLAGALLGVVWLLICRRVILRRPPGGHGG